MEKSAKCDFWRCVNHLKSIVLVINSFCKPHFLCNFKNMLDLRPYLGTPLPNHRSSLAQVMLTGVDSSKPNHPNNQAKINPRHIQEAHHVPPSCRTGVLHGGSPCFQGSLPSFATNLNGVNKIDLMSEWQSPMWVKELWFLLHDHAQKKQVTQSKKMCDCYELWSLIMAYPIIFPTAENDLWVGTLSTHA